MDAAPNMDEDGGFKWWIVLCLMLSWTVVFFIVCKGIQSSGKVIKQDLLGGLARLKPFLINFRWFTSPVSFLILFVSIKVNIFTIFNPFYKDFRSSRIN